ncbi:MAG: CHAT domain-containing protein, partial [Alphaproteobacteria bacterium]|nr:CHAT domain-containing protein [Alphaproteobacteria bacterium]
AATGAARAELSARAARSVRSPLDRAFSAFLDAAAQSPATPALAEEAFVAAQDLEVSAAGLAMAQTAARTAAGSGELAGLARRQQDLSARVRALDARAIEALGQGLADKAAALRTELEAAAAQLAAVDAQLRQRHPAYATLVSPRPLTLADVRQRLAPGEGLLFIVPSGEDLYAFTVGARTSAWRRLPGGLAPVRAQVAALRCAVDPDTCAGKTGEPPAFDTAIAQALYRDLVKPVEPGLGGARRLFVTAGGPLADLPLDALVTAAPRAKAADRFAGVEWLGDRYAITSLPSVSVLRARRAQVARGPGSAAFVGYGDPVFPPLKDARTRAAAGVDLSLLRGLAPLPGTRLELNAMARALDAAPGSVVLGAAATEPAVRADPRIRAARVVAFATHGLLPGELNGRNEPALVFSPPETPGPADDGLLSASEVSELSLDADWVVLSACNTASAEGGSDSLSALARAFLYAGAHALLATHWRVADEPTAALTVEMLSTAAAHPELSRAEARQRAIRAVRSGRHADGSAVPNWTADWRDPAAWAPFTLIAASSD